MSRVQLALRVPDLNASIAFYSKLFGTEPATLRDGYANFAITEPPLKLVLIEGTAEETTRLDHLGVEVESTENVHAARVLAVILAGESDEGGGSPPLRTPGRRSARTPVHRRLCGHATGTRRRHIPRGATHPRRTRRTR
ncbi:VOC family protein [Streptomyces sp. NPDC012616]|uniref:VOC family protein n=1 Tax=Streptomyces sp. NPDC012616 TaxID=3364840 RepID=UPI0036EC53A4